MPTGRWRGPRPSELSFICRYSTWQDPSGKVVYYVFPRGARRPILIAKTTRSAAHAATIRREAQNAFTAWQRIKTVMPDGMPRPLALEELNGVPVYFETAVPGMTLPERAGRLGSDARKRALLEQALQEAFAWLARFTQAMPHEHVVLDAEKIETWFIAPIRQFRPQAAAWPGGAAHLTALEGTVREWAGCTFPLVAAHGDFWGGSLLWGECGLCVIDWEFFRERALPTADAFMPAAHPGFCVGFRRGGTLLDEFRSMFLDARTAAAAQERVMAYLDLWRIPRAWFPSLLSLFLIERSLDRDMLLRNRAEGRWADLMHACIDFRTRR